MLAHALQHVDAVGVGLHVVQPAGRDQSCAMPARLSPTSVLQDSQLRRPRAIRRMARSTRLVSTRMRAFVRVPRALDPCGRMPAIAEGEAGVTGAA